VSEVPNAIAYPIIGAMLLTAGFFIVHEMPGEAPATQLQAQVQAKTPPRPMQIEMRPAYIPDDECQKATRVFDEATEDAMSSATGCGSLTGDTVAFGQCMNEAMRASSRQSAAEIDVEKACDAKTHATIRRMLGMK